MMRRAEVGLGTNLRYRVALTLAKAPIVPSFPFHKTSYKTSCLLAAVDTSTFTITSL
jgi:hypothetical protein